MHHSMTAFARVNEQHDKFNVTIEMRSVNHRYLEIFPHIPELFRHLEGDIRDKVQQSFKRGKVDIWVSYELTDSELQTSINRQAVEYWLEQMNAATASRPINSPNWQTLIALPGVVDNSKVVSEDNDAWFLGLLDQALVAMLAHRAREGEGIVKVLNTRLDDIEVLVKRLQAHIPEVNKALEAQLRLKLADIKIQVDQSRFEQELIFLLSKADVGEELDRLTFHLKEARYTLNKEGAIGRRLDFLMQEFNRESNTLGAKAADNVLSQASVELKVLIEQMREQIQNIE